MSLKQLTAAASAIGSLSIAFPASAQEMPDADDEAAQTDVRQGTSQDETARGRIFEPAYFDQFVPRNALNMVDRLPGFSISGGGGGGRGLGQANQNVLVNGERLSSKSDSVRDQLERIPAGDVVRIEIVDGTSLDVPGLTGQVANVIVDLAGISGTFSWKARLRDTAVDPEWYGGEISVAGTTGDLTFTLALANENNRFGAEGPTLITDAAGALIQTEDTIFVGAFDKPTFTANLGYDFGNDITATVNLSYAKSFFQRNEDETIRGPQIEPNLRTIRTREDGNAEYEISGDLSIPIGQGSLKIIGVESYDSEDFSQEVIVDFANPQLVSTGDLFTADTRTGERIGRTEYDFPLFGVDWQLAGEAAFNRLDRTSGLFELDPGGEFVAIDFEDGSGGVREARYNVAISTSTALTDRLSLQATLGYEFSKIKQTGSAANDRSFKRPKGSASLAWNNGRGLDLTLSAERRVGQLSFGEFLSRVFLDDENQNAGNNELVPSQTWEATLEINKTLGAWGSTTFMFEQRWIEDAIDLIPLVGGGEARGNIPNARRTEIEWNTTLLLNQIGIQGGQLDVRLEYEEGEIRDPLTGDLRDFSGGVDRELEIDYRHDIPGSSFAYGARLQYERDRRQFRLEEVSRGFAGPTFGDLFIEHKDIAGLTVRATAGNLLGGRVRLDRTVFDGARNTAPILFIEDRNRRIGPIFRLDVSGNF